MKYKLRNITIDGQNARKKKYSKLWHWDFFSSGLRFQKGTKTVHFGDTPQRDNFLIFLRYQC